VRDRSFENQKERSPECWLHATELGLNMGLFNHSPTNDFSRDRTGFAMRGASWSSDNDCA